MKNKKLYITLFALSIIFLGIGGTFAYLTVSVNATNITQIKSGNLTMTIAGGGNENVTLFPAKCTSEYAIKKTIKASAVNTSGGKVSFSIGMNIATLGADLKRNTMKYALTTVANSCTDGLIASGNFSEATVFCNDRSGGTNGSDLYFEARTRLYANKQPSLKCQNTKDKFTVEISNGNGSLTYPIGLITADEIAYAGGVFNASNSSFYLYNGINVWSLSPSYLNSAGARAFHMATTANLSTDYINISHGIRPSISLKPGTILSSGNGSAASPYIIE